MSSSRMRYQFVFSWLILGITAVSAQSFRLTLGDTIRSGLLGVEMIFEADVRNISAGVLTLAFVRASNDLPSGWQSAMCVNQMCFAPTVDSVVLNPDFGCTPLRSGDSMSFSVHVTPQSSNGTGTVRVVARDANNPADSASMHFIVTTVPNTVSQAGNRPASFLLFQNYPNPWNPSTRIRYTIVEGGWVRLSLHDVLGRCVATLVQEQQPPGTYEVEISRSAIPVADLSSGTYWYRLLSGGVRQSRKMVLLR